MNFSIILSHCKAFFYKIASISILYFNYLIKLSLVVVLNRGMLINAIRTIRKKKRLAISPQNKGTAVVNTGFYFLPTP
jgi:uncharacterized membrane protein YjjP (DUF1212 family)